MQSVDKLAVSIRPMEADDRAEVAEIIARVGNFNQAEIQCALELVDIFLHDDVQEDYRLVVAREEGRRVQGYACWGPTPLTRGTYDLYWIATHPDSQGRGVGTELMSYVEAKVQELSGRLLVVETSTKESYGATVRFYRRLGYEEASLIRDFYDTGDDKLVFVKRFAR